MLGQSILVIVHLVQPSPALVLETPGFYDVLVERLGHSNDPMIRDLYIYMYI